MQIQIQSGSSNIIIGFLALLGFASMGCKAASLMANSMEVSFFAQYENL
jgi:hypothetical protein